MANWANPLSPFPHIVSLRQLVVIKGFEIWPRESKDRILKWLGSNLYNFELRIMLGSKEVNRTIAHYHPYHQQAGGGATQWPMEAAGTFTGGQERTAMETTRVLL